MAVGAERILVIENDRDHLELMLHTLRRAGYQVEGERQGEAGLDRARAESPDLALLGHPIPGASAAELCRQLAADPRTRSVSVILVIGRDADPDAALERVGHDRIRRPFSQKVLLARVRAVLRRRSGRTRADENPTPTTRVELPSLVVDASRHEVHVDGQLVSFTATEFRLLHFLASSPGRAFTRAQLLSHVFGEHAALLDRNVDAHVAVVRRKLGARRDRIETIRGVGYRFVAERP